jgi:hypothetical protein
MYENANKSVFNWGDCGSFEMQENCEKRGKASDFRFLVSAFYGQFQTVFFGIKF